MTTNQPQNTMGAAALLALIAQYGPPAIGLAKQVYDFVKHPDPSPADWDTLEKSVDALDYNGAIAAARLKSGAGLS